MWAVSLFPEMSLSPVCYQLFLRNNNICWLTVILTQCHTPREKSLIGSWSRGKIEVNLWNRFPISLAHISALTGFSWLVQVTAVSHWSFTDHYLNCQEIWPLASLMGSKQTTKVPVHSVPINLCITSQHTLILGFVIFILCIWLQHYTTVHSHSSSVCIICIYEFFTKINFTSPSFLSAKMWCYCWIWLREREMLVRREERRESSIKIPMKGVRCCQHLTEVLWWLVMVWDWGRLKRDINMTPSNWNVSSFSAKNDL